MSCKFLVYSHLYKHRRLLETGYFGLRKKGDCTIRSAKIKATPTEKKGPAWIYFCRLRILNVWKM